MKLGNSEIYTSQKSITPGLVIATDANLQRRGMVEAEFDKREVEELRDYCDAFLVGEMIPTGRNVTHRW
jgi:hypothetical protein